jgi:hypothetical protein
MRQFEIKTGTTRGTTVASNGIQKGTIRATLDSALGAITAVYTGKAHVDGVARQKGSCRRSPSTD